MYLHIVPEILDAHHEKTDLKVFVVVIPKEGLVVWGPANPSLGLKSTIKYYCTAFIDYILCHTKEELAGPQATNPSLGMKMTTTKTLRPVFS